MCVRACVSVSPGCVSEALTGANSVPLAALAMPTRRKGSSSVVSENAPQTPDDVGQQKPTSGPPKLGLIISVWAAFFVPFFYMVFRHYDIEPELRRSIAINTAMSFGGFVVVVWFIPAAARYLLKRSMFGYDINKKGTPQGAVKVPESLGIVTGIVFLVVTIVFQQFNFKSDSSALSCFFYFWLRHVLSGWYK